MDIRNLTEEQKKILLDSLLVKISDYHGTMTNTSTPIKEREEAGKDYLEAINMFRTILPGMPCPCCGSIPEERG